MAGEMTRLEAAARLGLSEREVTSVREHPAGHIAALSAGRPNMLITAEVARRYVPDVDDPAVEDEAAGSEVEATPAETAPPRTSRRRAS